jgi:uncharacterized protein (TIGR02453 family)
MSPVALAGMAFRGWPVEAIEFYEGLEADNTKIYWQAHKAVYDEAVAGPMADLLADLAAEFGEGRIFRPYRDVRFSPDKSPYKTAIGASLAKGGYVQLSSAGLAAGSGAWMMEPGQLERYRQAIIDERSGAELAGLVDSLRRAGFDVTSHDSLKTAPRGYPKDHERAELLRYKGLAAWKQWPTGAWLGTSRAKTRIVDFFRASGPLNDWLAAHAGGGAMVDERA